MDSEKHELLLRYEKNDAFRKQMQKADENYKIMKQHAHYTNLSAVNEMLVSKFTPQKPLKADIYFVYGVYMNNQKVSMNLITEYFVTVFPKPKKPYIFVYFNDYENSNEFSNFKNMLSIMPLDYFLFLEAIYIVKPSLRMKASRYFTFGTLAKFINNKTINIDSIQQLSTNLKAKPQQITKILPLEIRNYFIDEQVKINEPVFINANNAEYNNKGMTLSQKVPQGNQKQSRPLNISQKPALSNIQAQNQRTKLQIDQYVKSQRGIPQVFQMFLHYFRQHGQELEQQGIFRKSINIQQQNVAIQKMDRKQYDYLEKVKDPHLVANLMKRFLAKLKSPLIPFNVFENLMADQNGYSVEIISSQMKKLSHQSITKYLTLTVLLDFLIRKVAPRAYKNKMNVHNLAVCFAPCLMWAQVRSLKDLVYINKSVATLQLMLNNFQQIFGSQNQLKKVFRSSFYQQQKKSIEQIYKAEQLNHQGFHHDQNRITPTFGQLVLEKAANEQKALETHSDGTDEEGLSYKIPNNKIQINIVSPNKITKSHIQKNQLLQDQSLLQRKSDRAVKQDRNNINQIEPPVNNQVKKRGIFNSVISSPKSAKNKLQFKSQIKQDISQGKSDKAIKSIHS